MLKQLSTGVVSKKQEEMASLEYKSIMKHVDRNLSENLDIHNNLHLAGDLTFGSNSMNDSKQKFQAQISFVSLARILP
jgi:hypothetical protein